MRRFAVGCVGKRMAPGRGSGKRQLHGGSAGANSRTQHPGEQEDRKRGPEAAVVVSTPKLASS